MQQVIALLEQALLLLKGMAQPAPATLPPQPSHPGPSRELAWGKRVSETFKERVWWIADELTKLQGSLFDANWLMGCMAFESANSFRADKRNPASSATGLIQFMAATARELGTTTERLAAMTAEDQLNYVYKYFVDKIKSRGPINSLADCYMAILWPAGMGKPTEYALWVKGSNAYAVNSGLDINKDHKVTKAEAAAKVAQRLADGMTEENYG